MSQEQKASNRPNYT